MQKKIDTFTDEQIYEFIEKSKSFRQLILKLGFSSNGSGDYVYVKTQLDKRDINYQRLLKIRTNSNTVLKVDEKGRILQKYSNEEVFIVNSKLDRGSIKKRILDQKLILYVCQGCGLGDEWNGKKISLQLEHKNGVNNDNRLENLCFLCPNCHSQTDTFSSKRNKIKYFCECGATKCKKSTKCLKCANKLKKTKQKPDINTLISQISLMGYVKVGKKYGVSDNAIRKWVKSCGVDPKSIKK